VLLLRGRGDDAPAVRMALHADLQVMIDPADDAVNLSTRNVTEADVFAHRMAVKSGAQFPRYILADMAAVEAGAELPETQAETEALSALPVVSMAALLDKAHELPEAGESAGQEEGQGEAPERWQEAAWSSRNTDGHCAKRSSRRPARHPLQSCPAFAGC
jgi:hypothetical protein